MENVGKEFKIACDGCVKAFNELNELMAKLESLTAHKAVHPNPHPFGIYFQIPRR